MKLLPALALCTAVFTLIAARFLGQDADVAPSPMPSPSPSSSASQTPSPKPTSSPVPTAQNFHQWGSITLFNGLPSDSIRAIAQTADGVMWFGTDNGLARFDGRRLQNFSLGGADENRVLALEARANGELWVGTGAGAFVYSNSRFDQVENTQGLVITSLVGRADDIWRPGVDLDVVLGTESGMILVARRGENGSPFATQLSRGPILSTDGTPVSITGLIQTDHGGVLASTSGRGVLFVDDGIAESESSFSVRSPFVNAIIRDSKLNVWLGVDAARGASGVFTAEPDEMPVRIAAATAKVLTLAANDHGTWAGTERSGLFHVVDSKIKKNYTFENTSGGLRSNTIFTLFTDREGVVWIGTNRGVSRFDPAAAMQENVSDIANSNFIRTLWRSVDGRTLFAGSNRGLFSYVNEKWNRMSVLGDKAVYALGTTVNGIVIGTAAGTFDLNGRLITGSDTRSFATYRGETYAAVAGRGVASIRSGKQEVVFPDETASALLVSGDRLLIGTGGRGLFSFDGRRVHQDVSPELLKSGTIWKICQSADGSVWVAGQHGVFRIQDGNVEKVIEADDVRDVYVDGSDVWAATTTRGLIHSRHDERFGWIVSSIGFEQGLPSEKAFSILPIDDGFLIATNRGVVRYRPHDVAPKLIVTRVLSIRIHDLGELASTIELEYPQNSLQVEVAGQSSRTFPEEFQYAFQLKNANGEIVDSRFSKVAQYSPVALPPGEYAIESIAYDRDLNASGPLRLKFSVAKAPFPWTATALAVLLAISLIALIWAMIERRHIAQRNAELAAARFDLASEAERERSRIARDLHDQTLADLRNLLMMSDRLSPPNAEFRSEIESVSTEIRRICEDLSPSVLENVGLVAALEFLLSRSVADHRFAAVEDANERVNFPIIEQLHIYRIAQEILTNIDRHSDATRVEMGVGVFDDGRFLLTIRDNGSVFRHGDAVAKGRGIANIRSRANIINARVGWDLPPEGGNVFSLEIARSA